MEHKEEDPEALKNLIKSNPRVTDYYRVIFNKCDKNRDGFISTRELKIFIETEEENPIPGKVIKEVHRNFDKNGDQQLDFEEFLIMINSPEITNTFRRLRSRYIKFVVTVPAKKLVRLQSCISSTGQYEEEQTFKKHTVGMITLSLIQIILYYVNLALVSADHPQGPIRDALKFTPSKKLEIWRYVTHIFVHADAYHLFPNVIIQLLNGIALEMVHSWRVLVIYVAGALGGCLAHSVIVPSRGLVGGSGGFYAFFTAHIATVIMNWSEMSHPAVQLLIFGVITICDPIYNYVFQNDMTNVSYIAHLGGAVVGLLVGVNILKNLKETKKEKIIWYICMVTYITLMTTLIVLSIIKSNSCFS